MKSPTTRTLPMIALLAMSACLGSEEGMVFVPVDDDPRIQDDASAWIGTYEGSGRGSVSGSPIEIDEARLSVRLDADSVRLASCPRCLTVSLDTLFRLENIDPASQVSLTLAYGSGDDRRALQLDRYSGGGGVGNVLTARLAVGRSSDPSTSIEYLLQRR